MPNRRTVLKTLLPSAAGLGFTQPANADGPKKQILSSSIPTECDLIGSLGKPICTLVHVRGTWVERNTKMSPICFRVDTVDGTEMSSPVLFPRHLLSVAIPDGTIDVLPDGTIKTTAPGERFFKREIVIGKSWAGLVFESVEYRWKPEDFFDLPEVPVPWYTGLITGPAASLNFVADRDEASPK